MGVIMNIQGDFEMTLKTLDTGEPLEEWEVKDIVERLQTGECFVTIERRRVVDYAGGDAIDICAFDLEPTDWTEYSYEHFNEL